MSIKIIEHDWSWRHSLAARRATDAIVLHHAAARVASAEDIHKAHLQRDGGTWAGIGYHLYIRKNGEIHRGRPIWASGAHVLGHNGHTVGICCEGNYDEEAVMPVAQLQAVREALRYLKDLYPNAAIKCHRDLQATACPGRFYPLAEVLKYNQPEIPAESEEEDMQRYNTVAELPEPYRAGIQKLIDLGKLKGKGDVNHLDLTEDMARILIICGRMEGVL
jgi:N-acetyl-anhydromuramyl-L-alanine amidase AmpD